MNNSTFYWSGMSLLHFSSVFIPADLFHYDMVFPSKHGASFAAITLDSTIEMYTMTLCMWLQTIDPGPFHLFSYTTFDGTRELSLGCESSEDCELVLLRESRLVSQPDVHSHIMLRPPSLRPPCTSTYMYHPPVHQST